VSESENTERVQDHAVWWGECGWMNLQLNVYSTFRHLCRGFQLPRAPHEVGEEVPPHRCRCVLCGEFLPEGTIAFRSNGELVGGMSGT